MHKKILTILFFVLFAAPEAVWLWGSVPCFAQVDTAWVRRYDGPVNGGGCAYDLALDNSGNIYVTGLSLGSGTRFDYATIKYYPNGDTAWVRRYNGPTNDDDEAYAIAVDDSGNVYVTGISMGSGGYWDYATIKYYPNGDTAWLRRYDGPGNRDDYASAIATDNSGNVYVTGPSWSSGTDYDFATIKYHPNGDTAWVRRYTGPTFLPDHANAIAVDDSGNVYVTGYSTGSGTSYDMTTIKYYPNGDTAWVRKYNGPVNGGDGAYAIAVDGSGNVYVTGYIEDNGPNWEDYATIRYYPNGDTAWVRTYDGPANYFDEAWALSIDDSGNVYVTGRSWGSGPYYDYATIKYHPNGDTAWVRRYNGSGNDDDFAKAIAVDDSGNVYVTGYSTGSGTSYDVATIKYYPNGDTAWVHRYDGPANFSDEAYAIEVDTSGNVYVTGLSSVPVPGTSRDYNNNYVTIKYIQFLRGDANADGVINVTDVVYLINYLFLIPPGPAPEPLDAGDVNCDGVINVTDVVYLINYLFLVPPGPPPCS
jgi:uncharacterized delta-60 repeat protein